MIGLLVIVALLLVMWLVLVRPQRRRQLAQRDMLSNLHVGDEIVTAGGLYGEIEEIGDEDLLVEIAPDVSVRVAKRAVAAVTPADEEEEAEAELEAEPELEAAAEPEAAASQEAAAADREQASTRPRPS